MRKSYRMFTSNIWIENIPWIGRKTLVTLADARTFDLIDLIKLHLK